MLSTVVALLLALFKAIPALEALARTAVAESDKARQREADQRLEQKDARVDDALAKVASDEEARVKALALDHAVDADQPKLP